MDWTAAGSIRGRDSDFSLRHQIQKRKRKGGHNLAFCAEILSKEIITTKFLCAFTFSALFNDAVNCRDYIGRVTDEHMSVQ